MFEMSALREYSRLILLVELKGLKLATSVDVGRFTFKLTCFICEPGT